MLTRYLLAAFTVMGPMSVAPAAHAAAYDFSYKALAGVVSATVFGTLQPDNNTIFVSSITNPEFDGVARAPLPFLTTVADYFARPGPATPEVSLDGLNVNFLACDSSACADGYFFDTAGVYGGFPEFFAGPSYGGGFETYNPSNFTIAFVPEPATWTMMLAGMGGLGLVMGWRRKQAGPVVAP